MATQPQTLEIRTSKIKFALLLLCYSPIVAVGPAVFFWGWSVGVEDGRLDAIELWGPALLWTAGWPVFVAYFWRLSRVLLADEAFMRLTPKGLVMPSLGSEQPIAWDRVEIELPSGKELTPGMTFQLNVDPETHTRILGAARWFGRRDRAVVTVPSVFDADRGQIFATIDQFKAFAADSAARRERSAHPSSAGTPLPGYTPSPA